MTSSPPNTPTNHKPRNTEGPAVENTIFKVIVRHAIFDLKIKTNSNHEKFFGPK